MAEEFNLKFKLSLDNKNELSDTLKKAERDAKSFSDNLRKGILDAGKQIAGFSAQTAKSLSQLATGDLGIASSAKRMLQLRDAIAQLHVQAGKASPGMEKLRQDIHRIASASNQMQEDVTEAFAAFVAKTGDITTASKNMELYGRVATATKASLQDVANVGVELKQKLGIEDQAKSMAMLVEQAKQGAIEFKDMASVGPRIFAAAASQGVSGEKGLAATGAAIQVIASGFGGKGQGRSAATAYENLIATLQKAKTRGAIEDLGIKVEGRDPAEVFMDVIRKTGGDATKLREIFRTQQAFRGSATFARDLSTGFADFNRFNSAAGDSKALDDDFNTMRSTGLAALNASQIKIAESIDNKLGPAFERLAKHSDKLADVVSAIIENPVKAAAGAALGLVALNIAKNAVPALLAGGVGGIGGKIPGLGGKAGVPHVWVDNMPGSGVPGSSGGPGGQGRLAAAGKIAGSLTAGVGIGMVLDETFGISDAWSKQMDWGSTMRNRVDDKARANVRLRAPTAGQLAAAQVSNHITVVVADDKATVTDDGGTRSAATLKRRMGAGGR